MTFGTWKQRNAPRGWHVLSEFGQQQGGWCIWKQRGMVPEVRVVVGSRQALCRCAEYSELYFYWDGKPLEEWRNQIKIFKGLCWMLYGEQTVAGLGRKLGDWSGGWQNNSGKRCWCLKPRVAGWWSSEEWLHLGSVLKVGLGRIYV